MIVGTVTVSYSLGENSSASEPRRAPQKAERNTYPKPAL